MTLLYLVRHGQTEWSRSGQHTSVTDLDLTEQGVEQARSLRTRLDPSDFQLVLSSPRLRARRTAELAGFADPEITETEASTTTRVAILNFSSEKSGLIRCGSHSTRTDMP